MSVEVNAGLLPPDRGPQEVVERKGMGHPDTLADGLAEATELDYARYALGRFGFIPHHNLDKLSVAGGLCVQAFGGNDFTRPIRVTFGGRASGSFGGEEIPLEEIQDGSARTYLGRVLPHLDTSNPTAFQVRTETSTNSTRPNWFSPRSEEDLPEYAGPSPRANDTVTMISYWPLTDTERLALGLEGYFWEEGEDGLVVPRFDWIGQDIKVMAVRAGDQINATLCVPQISTETPDENIYFEREAHIVEELKNRAQELTDGKDGVSVRVNTANQPGRMPYMVTGGSCVDFGEEGAVGRGNKTHGIISSFRPNTMEAPEGKNPTYFGGKVLGYHADQIARTVYEKTGVGVQVVMQVDNGGNLYDPRVIVSTESPVSEAEVTGIVEASLDIGRGTTTRIIDEAYFLPSTLAWKGKE